MDAPPCNRSKHHNCFRCTLVFTAGTKWYSSLQEFRCRLRNGLRGLDGSPPRYTFSAVDHQREVRLLSLCVLTCFEPDNPSTEPGSMYITSDQKWYSTHQHPPHSVCCFTTIPIPCTGGAQSECIPSCASDAMHVLLQV